MVRTRGIAAAGHAQGRSVSATPRSVWFFEHKFPDGGWIPSSEGIRSHRWKYIRYTDNAAPFGELYDLRTVWRQALRQWQPGQAWTDPISEQDLARDGLNV
jgi:hypothetical protein